MHYISLATAVSETQGHKNAKLHLLDALQTLSYASHCCICPMHCIVVAALVEDVKFAPANSCICAMHSSLVAVTTINFRSQNQPTVASIRCTANLLLLGAEMGKDNFYLVASVRCTTKTSSPHVAPVRRTPVKQHPLEYLNKLELLHLHRLAHNRPSQPIQYRAAP